MKRTGVDVMKKLEQLYEGKAKKVFATEDPDVVIVDYKDDATAFNGEKKRNDRRKRRDQQPYDELCIPGFGKRRSSDTLCRRTQR